VRFKTHCYTYIYAYIILLTDLDLLPLPLHDPCFIPHAVALAQHVHPVAGLEGREVLVELEGGLLQWCGFVGVWVRVGDRRQAGRQAAPSSQNRSAATGA
jgi:hypothetical protein